jgi:hypothetical protein
VVEVWILMHHGYPFVEFLGQLSEITIPPSRAHAMLKPSPFTANTATVRSDRRVPRKREHITVRE